MTEVANHRAYRSALENARGHAEVVVHDKPAEYPLLFSRATAVALSKCGWEARANFEMPLAKSNIARVNAEVSSMEAGAGWAGDDELVRWIMGVHRRDWEEVGTV